MIVRINEIDAATAEAAGDWGLDPRRGPISYDWPAGTRAFEVVVLDRDEHGRPVADAFRHNQLRHLIAETIAALREPGEETVLRLDGALAEGELLYAVEHVADTRWYGRFLLSETGRLEAEPREVIASLRVHCPLASVAVLCADPHLGLHRSVRLRAFGVPDRLIVPLMSLGVADDDRWDDVMPYAGFQVGTVRGLRGLHVLTPRLDAATFRARLTRRLLAAAAAAPPAPPAPPADRAGDAV